MKVIVANKLLLDHLGEQILLKSFVTFENKYLFKNKSCFLI